ncbi:hypothetical protein FGB62_244g00 [Gracilaria domingensis]|nr:hypothetical protein FGB62_244g00 [Gracilaria domingensis]
MNILSIVVALERDEILTVSDTGFRGVSIGVLNETEIQGKRGLTRRICEQIPTSPGGNDEMLLDFSICSGFIIIGPLYVGTNEYEEILQDEVKEGTRVMAVDWPPGAISVSFKHGVLENIYRFWIDIRHDNEILRTKPNWSADDARFLVRKAAMALRLQCTLILGREPDTIEELQIEKQEQGFTRAWTTVGCEGTNELLAVTAGLFASDVGIVDSERFVVGTVDPKDGDQGRVEEFVDGGSLKLIRRRQSLGPLGVLAVATALAILLRFVLQVFLNADVDDAIDIVVRHVLGLSSGRNDTLLGVGDKFRVDHKYRWGDTLYLGLRTDEDEEVEAFDEGILSCAPKQQLSFASERLQEVCNKLHTCVPRIKTGIF